MIGRIGLSLALVLCAASGCDNASPTKPAAQAKTSASKDSASGATADKDAKQKAGEDKIADKTADKTAVDKPGTGKPAAEGAPTEEQLFAALDKRVSRAAKLAREIEKKPENADDILDAADLDRAGFEELMYTIGADPALSKQYQLALTDD